MEIRYQFFLSIAIFCTWSKFSNINEKKKKKIGKIKNVFKNRNTVK